MTTSTRTAAMLATALAALPGAALAEYPEKPVEFVVPWPPAPTDEAD